MLEPRSPSTKEWPAGHSSSIVQHAPSVVNDRERQRRGQSIVQFQGPRVNLCEVESSVAESQPITYDLENVEQSISTPEQCASLSTACQQALPPNPNNGPDRYFILPEDSPMSQQSLDLEVFGFIASNPLDLHFPTAHHWTKSIYHDAAGKDLTSQLHDHMAEMARNGSLTPQEIPEPNSTSHSRSTQSPIWVSRRESLAGSGSSQSGPASLLVTEERYIDLWRNYLDEIAPWLDLFDDENHWRTTVAHMAQRVECLRHSILAISARQQERRNPGRPHTESLILYQEAIRLIMVQLPTLCTEVVAACVLLCVLEMMCMSPRAWAKHLDGCAILFEAAHINGLVGGVKGALFWTVARMDAYRALISDTIAIPLTNRLSISADPMSAAVYFKSGSGNVIYANYVLFLFASVMNLLSTEESTWAQSNSKSDGTFVSQWKAMSDLLEGWYNDRPEELRPLMQIPPSKKEPRSPFSTILYSAPIGISSNQVYHASMILLLQNKPKEITLPRSHKSTLWHARQVCGIALSNGDLGALIHGLQPIWIAGKLMSHYSEHQAILGFLKRLEEQSGWGTAWRAKGLQEFWGDSDETG